MLNKRINVFETNSSSVHSLTIGEYNENDLVVEKDGYIHLSMPYYGKSFDVFSNSYDKLCYALLVVCYTHGIYLDWYYPPDCNLSEEDWETECDYWRCSLSDLEDTIEYQAIEECVISEMTRIGKPCKGIKIHQSSCGIDHQSQDNDSLYEFLEEHKVESIHEFIFGNITLTTGRD